MGTTHSEQPSVSTYIHDSGRVHEGIHEYRMKQSLVLTILLGNLGGGCVKIESTAHLSPEKLQYDGV